ncbi:putative non-LTR retroelement reverse transcriptase, partial [Trifolium medium]|nr:putative non-LTR retroelement reverse transcriptase [Trifolium medium]
WKEVLKSKYGVGVVGRTELGEDYKPWFWEEKWVGDISLRDRFPRLFSISIQKDVSVADVRNPTSDLERWRLLWRRRIFEWENCLLSELLELINTATFLDVEDQWGWVSEGGQAFTVKSTYWIVSNLPLHDFQLVPSHAAVFTQIWKRLAPSKVSGFVWQLLHGRVPTRDNL